MDDDVPEDVLEYLSRLAYNARVRLELAKRLNEQGIINARDVLAAEQRAHHDEGLLKDYIHQQRRRGTRERSSKQGIDTNEDG